MNPSAPTTSLGVLVVVSTRGRGGMEDYACRVAAELRDQGHRVVFACREGSFISETLQTLGVEAPPIAPRNSADLPAARRLAALIRRERLDVVHAHKAKDYVPAVLAARLSGRQAVLTRHDLFPMSAYSRQGALRAHCIMAVSHAVENLLIGQVRLPPEKVCTVWPSINTNLLQPLCGPRIALPALGFEGPVFGMVNRLFESKRCDTFLRAAAALKQTHPEARFLIVGDGPHRSAIENLIQALNLGGEVLLTGFVPDALGIMKELAAFVSGAENEAFGYSILEAMACGVPVLAAAAGGAAELLEDRISGAYFPPGDHGALAKLMRSVLDHPIHARAWGAAARIRACEEFNRDTMLSRIEDVYRAAAQHPSRS